MSRDNLCLEDRPLKSILGLHKKIKHSKKAIINTVYCTEYIFLQEIRKAKNLYIYNTGNSGAGEKIN